MLFNFYTCKEALERLDDYIDQELTPVETQRVRRHLAICHACTKKFAFEADLMQEIRVKVQQIDVGEEFQQRLLESLSQTPET